MGVCDLRGVVRDCALLFHFHSVVFIRPNSQGIHGLLHAEFEDPVQAIKFFAIERPFLVAQCAGNHRGYEDCHSESDSVVEVLA